MDSVTTTGLQMNELATEIADSWRSTPPRCGCASHDAAQRRAGDRRRRGDRRRLRRGARRWREICMGGLGNVDLLADPDRRRGVARTSRCGPIIRPSRAWPRSTPAGPSRSTSSSPWARVRSGRTRGSSASCSRSSATRRRPPHGRAGARGAHAPHRRGGRLGGGEGPARSPPSSLSWSRRPRASRAASRSPPGSWRPGLHKMETLGFDVRRVVSAHRHRADPAGGQERPARHRPHQRLHPVRRAGALHGSRRATPSWRSWRAKVPASASRDYGTPFYEIFQRYEGDFYKIDPLLFSPAEVWLTSTESGRTFHAGRLNPEVLTASCYPS